LEKCVLRVVAAQNAGEFDGFLHTRVAREGMEKKRLVSTRRISGREAVARCESSILESLLRRWPEGALYEHERIPFPSFPHEWPPEMLWEAGRLTLELGRAALAEGYGLKDATPRNVMFDGCRPVFIDMLSFERRDPGDPLWKPYAQFIRNFLLPLMANQRWGLPLADVFVSRRDGLEPEEVYRLCGQWERLNPAILPLVSLPVWLGRKAGGDETVYQPRPLADAEKARYIVDSVFGRLERALRRLKPSAQGKSTWSDYMGTHSYEDPAFSAKEGFVKEALEQFKPSRVLDAGANTGHFSALSARAGAEVVAVDSDPVCVDQVWRRAHTQQLSILPLVVDLARPSPALGWRNRECASFLDRACGAFDGVLMLALVHHLLVTERIPLEDILELASQWTSSLLVIEFVAPEDGMFRRLTRGRDHLHAGLNEGVFREACAARFDIVKSLALPGTKRSMYCLKLKEAH
jgi:SAM-dependent methyltransferase